MKASELIAELENLIRLYGDKEVFSGGEDYPNTVSGATYSGNGNTYVRRDSFVIHARDVM